MFGRILAYLVLIQFFLCGVFLSESVFGQQPASGSRTCAVGTEDSTHPSKISFPMALDVYLEGPDKSSVDETAVLTLLTMAGELCKQGTTRKGHLRWNEVAPMRYMIQVVAPGFQRAVQEIEPHGPGEFRVTVQLRPPVDEDKAYPPISADPDVNYVFGEYASRLHDWEQAKIYWTNVLQLLPDYVPALVSMSETLLSENRNSEALEYLYRAAKLDPSYWRTQAVLAEASLGAGSPSEAVHQAERAIELGQGEAASVSPLLARALVAEANEVLGTYLKGHPGDVAAKKQFEALNTPTQLHRPEQLNAGLREKSTATIPATAALRTHDSRWLPPEVDENVPTVESGSACNLEEVLQKTGQRIQEFVENVERFTATESLVHETINKSGEVSGSEKRKYDYTVSIQETRPGLLNVEEYQSGGSTAADSPGGMVTKGLPALVLIFHPSYAETFSMRCEGLAIFQGKRTWQIYFRQREDKPNKIRSYRVGSNTPFHPVALKGRAWIVADSHQILGLQTDLISSLPEIRLTAEHTAIEYGPVHFSSRGLDLWVPQTAEVYSELGGRRVHRRMSFSNYLLFAVDDKQQISSPSTSP
jgi:hypothetical protein